MVSQFEGRDNSGQAAQHELTKDLDLVPLTVRIGPQLGAMGFLGEKEMLEAAIEKAAAAKDIIEQQKWSVNLHGNRYVKCEGWTCLAAMTGLVPTIVGTMELENGARTAVAELRDCTGKALVRADAECGDELDGRWAREPGYSKRSMAQTRAISKACRASLSWVMTLAGYQATPYEEVQGRDFAGDSENSTVNLRHIKAIRDNAQSIAVMLEGFANRDDPDAMNEAATAWFELDVEEQKSLWLAPSKGGIFSTDERKLIKTTEFRELYFGKEDEPC